MGRSAARLGNWRLPCAAYGSETVLCYGHSPPPRGSLMFEQPTYVVLEIPSPVAEGIRA